MTLTAAQLEHDFAADEAAAMDAKRDALIERLWSNVNWNHYEDLPEIITQHKDFDDALKRYLKGDFSHLNVAVRRSKRICHHAPSGKDFIRAKLIMRLRALGGL